VPRSRALIDTSVIIDLERVKAQALPDEMAIAAISLAELAAGTHVESCASEGTLQTLVELMPDPAGTTKRQGAARRWHPEKSQFKEKQEWG